MTRWQVVVTAVTILGLSVVLQRPAAAQRSPDGLWEAVVDGATTDFQPLGAGPEFVRPQTYRVFRLDADGAITRLRLARQTLDADAPRITFPKPDGTFATFRVQETRTMSPGLSERNPDLKTYRGVGVDDPTATTRFERNRDTLNAVLLTAEGRFYVTPVRQLGAVRYLAYAARTEGQPDRAQATQGPVCLLDETRARAGREGEAELATAGRRDPVVPGSVLRTYRLAVGATGEYTEKNGGADGAFSAIVSTINRVNEVYERDLAIRLELIDRQRDLIQTDKDKDGYTNDSPSTLADENQPKIDDLIGSAAYDIGHVFGTGPGGYAPGKVCRNDQKARASTGRSDPTGDPFAIDYVSHEIGHQFTAGHTFNTTHGCSGRFASTAWEPGSGSTIMAYAGICASENVQVNTSPYFHSGSLDEIFRYAHVGTGATCGTTSATSNRAPIVEVARRVVTIPHSTPFVLRGTATDPDGDHLVYTWEQMDIGVSAPPNDDADGMRRPLFRSLPPGSDAQRSFPAIEHIGAAAPVLGHTLPVIARTLRMRLTARDGRFGGGAFAYAETQVTVTGAGPFLVRRPAAGKTWTAGSRQDVEWDPAGTQHPPISAANVRIAFSTDGGRTFPIELAASVPNNGHATVNVPAANTTRGRVRVEAIDNVFFNLSPGTFTIQP